LEINTLYKNVLNGDKNSENILFKELYVRFSLFAFQRIRNEGDIEEIVQDTMLTIINNYREINFETSFSAWAYNVLINKIRNYNRKKRAVRKYIREDLDNTEKHMDWGADPIFVPKLLDCLRQILVINKRYARVLNLKFQGYDTDFICKKLNISINNLYVIISRARSLLQECLDRGEIS